MENQPNTDIEAKLRRFRDLCDRLVVLADRDDYLGEEYQRGLEETLTLLSEEPALRPVLVGHFIDSVRAAG